MRTELLRAKSRKSDLEYRDALSELETTRREELRRTNTYKQKEISFWNEVFRSESKPPQERISTELPNTSEHLGRLYTLQSELKHAHQNRNVISKQVQEKIRRVECSKRELDIVEGAIKRSAPTRKARISESLAEEIENLALAQKKIVFNNEKTSPFTAQLDRESYPVPHTREAPLKHTPLDVNQTHSHRTTFLSSYERDTTTALSTILAPFTQVQDDSLSSIKVCGTAGYLRGVSVRVTRDSRHKIHVAVVLPPLRDVPGRPLIDKHTVESKLAQLGVQIHSVELESGSNNSGNSLVDYKRRKRNGRELYDEP